MLIFGAMGWLNPALIVNARGEKAVCNFDEDALTMAVAAGINCLKGFDRQAIEAVYFASTTAPYKERQNAGIIAGALCAPDEVRTADFGGSLKAGTSALLSAIEFVKAGSGSRAVVCAGDSRLGKMGSVQEMFFGDAGAAILVSDRDVVAEFKGSFSVTHDFVDHLRGADSKYDRQWEERWIRDFGYARFIPEAVEGLCNKYGLSLGDFSKVIYPCYYGGARKSINAKLGLEPEKVQDDMQATVGDSGAAHSLLMFAKALEEAKPGDKILLVSYGNGCDALWFEVTEAIEGLSERMRVSRSLARRADLDNYQKYLVWRDMAPADTGLRGEEDFVTRWSLEWRLHKAILGLQGTVCRKCGTQQWPPQRICVNPDCGAIDEMDRIYLADKGGTIFTYTSDLLAASINPPAIYGNVNFSGGGRSMFDFTDCTLEDLAVGKAVEFSFRIKYYDSKRDTTFYFWKAVPVQEEVS
jgi:3-hydroxy-3-methylglutaryl CoA synthase